MTTNLLIVLFAVAVIIAVAVFIRLRRQANGAVFPWIAPQAGFEPNLWRAVYWVGKLFFALVPGLSVLMLTEGTASAVGGLLATFVGFFVPDLWLLWKRKVRQGRIERSLSFFLDLLVSLLRAGLPVEEAFARAGTRGLPARHPLAEEVARTSNDLNAGVDRSEAYAGFVNRTGVDDARLVASSLDLGGRLGFSVADILAAQADVLRDKRLENGRRRIDRATISALLPVMLCGLPLLLVVVILPIAVDINQTFRLISNLF